MNHNDMHRYFGVTYNNRVWELLDKQDRSHSETDEMIHTAHASLLHWSQFAEHNAANLQRGSFMVALAYTSAGIAERAYHYALCCRKITTDNPDVMCDFDIAYSFCILAKTSAMMGLTADAQHHYQEAQRLGSFIANPKDKAIFDADWARFDI